MVPRHPQCCLCSPKGFVSHAIRLRQRWSNSQRHGIHSFLQRSHMKFLVLGFLVLLALITDCLCFKGAPAPLPLNKRSSIDVLRAPWVGKYASFTVYNQLRLDAARSCRNVPINLFTRGSPLKVRLEHRELASQFSAYAPTEGRQHAASMAGERKIEASDETYHLVFSYDPKVLSAKQEDFFHYLEGQSISFLKLRDTQSDSVTSLAAKPRLYSVASSPASPELGLQHFFSLCVRHHRYRGPDGQRDPSRDGLCSSLLCTAPIGTEFEVGGPIGAALLLPEDTSTPLVFACTGTGVAPLRSFIRKIIAKPREGPVIAYVGAARASTTPYAREWKALQDLLPSEQLKIRFAYSREMKTPKGGKLYVQHLIEEDGDELLGLLEGGATMYACGRKDMLPPIKSALQTAAGRNSLEFDSFYKKLLANRRWRAEVY